MDAIYASMGVNPGALGCVMLKVEPVPITIDDLGGEETMYTSANPALPWVAGYVNGKKPHVTLLYGLLDCVTDAAVDLVLKDCAIPTHVSIHRVGYFPSRSPVEEPYACVVAHIDVNYDLLRAHNQLCSLPHINRFPDFKAHVTLGYAKSSIDVDALVARLNTKLKDLPLVVVSRVFAPAGSPI